MSHETTDRFAWHPTPEEVGSSNLTAFLRAEGLPDFDALSKRADANPGWLWDSAIKFAGLRFYRPYHDIMDDSAGPAWTKWCVGGTTNMILNCFDRHRNTPIFDKTFLIWEGETGSTRSYSYVAFDSEICRFANGLRQLGYGRGDVIGLYMPQLPETFIAFYAIVKIGAIVMPLFSGFGARAIADRLALADAKAVVTVDGTLRRGSVVPMKQPVDEAADQVSTVRQVITVRHLDIPLARHETRDIWWHDVTRHMLAEARTEEVEAEHPAVLLFTSGTTGKPKGAIYTHIGFVTKMAFDIGVLTDFKATDRYFWMADMGWMVGSMSAIIPPLHGGSMVIAEGTPDYPTPDRIWDLVERHQITYLGLAPTIVRQAMRHGTDHLSKYDLSRLRIVYTGGEPWADKSWRWLLDNICRGRALIANGSGGTEVGGCILLCTLHHPLKPCSFSIGVPGMGADIVDEKGDSVPPGRIGELILRRPSIGLTPGLWRDKDRYIQTYWSQLPGAWTHGDLASRDQDGLWYIHGRSDDTLKIAGKRIGPAEIENVIMATGRIAEAAAIGVPDEVKGSALVLTCVPMPGETGGKELQAMLTDRIVADMGKAFRPRLIVFVSDLPKTRNAKIMRRAIRAAITGESPGDISALANPETIDQIREAYGAAIGQSDATA